MMKPSLAPADAYRMTALLPMAPAADLIRQLQTFSRQSLYRKGKLEFVVVDQGPAAGMIAPIQAQYKHLVYLSVHRSSSQGRALALGARIAAGPYLIFAALDDGLEENALEIMTAALDRDVHLGAVYDQMRGAQATMLFRRAVLTRIWEADRSLEHGEPEDWLARLGADGYRCATVAVGGASEAGSVNRVEAEEDIEASYDRLRRNVENLSDAQRADEMEALIGRAPRMAVAHNDLGVLCYRLGRKNDALRCYETAVTLDPDNQTFRKNLADFYYFEQGRVEDSLRIYVRLLATAPEDSEVLFTLGRISEDLERLEDARDFYRRVIEVAPDNADARGRLAALAPESKAPAALTSDQDTYDRVQALVADGRLDEAVRDLEQLVTRFPDFAPAHNDLGALYHRLGRQPEAVVACYERAVALVPEDSVYRKNLADFYQVVQGRTAEALRLYVRLLADYPQDVEVLMALGSVCENVGQSADARFFYNCVLECDPANDEAYRRVCALG